MHNKRGRVPVLVALGAAAALLGPPTEMMPFAPRSSDGPIHLLVDSTGLKLCGPGEWLIEKRDTRRRRQRVARMWLVS